MSIPGRAWIPACFSPDSGGAWRLDPCGWPCPSASLLDPSLQLWGPSWCRLLVSPPQHVCSVQACECLCRAHCMSPVKPVCPCLVVCLLSPGATPPWAPSTPLPPPPAAFRSPEQAVTGPRSDISMGFKTRSPDTQPGTNSPDSFFSSGPQTSLCMGGMEKAMLRPRGDSWGPQGMVGTHQAVLNLESPSLAGGPGRRQTGQGSG